MEQLGKYQLIRKIATGGMAEVFLARAAGPMGFQKTLVVKRILPHYAEDPSFVEMFLAEARIAAELNHPNIVQIFDFGREANTYFIAMEHIDGPNLRALEKRAKKTGLKMPFHLAAKIISLACDGLAFAHDHIDPETGQPLNLIHRDVSPDNILVSKSGAVKVVDFGIAKANTNKRGITKAGLVKGKMAYMSPEQLANEPLDRRSDVFALGIVFYELLTGGDVPFDDRNDALIVQSVMGPEPLWSLTKFRPDAPAPLVRILARALEKDVSRRYPNCKALQADLERFIVSVGKPVQGSELAELVRTLEADKRPEVSAGSLLTEPGEEPPPEVEAAGGGDVWSQVPDSPELEADFERTTRDPFERTTQDPFERTTQDPFDGVPGDPSDDERTARQPFVPDPPNSDTPLDQTLRTPQLGAAMKRRQLAARRRRAVFIGGGLGLLVLLTGGLLSRFAAPPPPPPPAPRPAFTLRPTPKPPPTEAVAESPAAAANPELAAAEPTREDGGTGSAELPAGATAAASVPGKSDNDAGTSSSPVTAPAEAVLAQASGEAPPPAAETPAEASKPAPATPAESPAADTTPTEPASPARSFTLKPASSRKTATVKTAAVKPAEVKPASTQGAPPPEPSKPAPKPAAEAPRSMAAQVQIRVRPYAQVYLDGTLLGETPLAPVMVAPGKHSLRLVNEKLGKDTTVELVVKANEENLFKYDLKEDR